MKHGHYRFDMNNPYCKATIILAGLLGWLVGFLYYEGTFDGMIYLGRSINEIVRIGVRGLMCLGILYIIYRVLEWWFEELTDLPETKISGQFYYAGVVMLAAGWMLGALISLAFYLLWIIAGFSFLSMVVYVISCRVCKSTLNNPIKFKENTYCQGCLDSLKEDFGSGVV